MYGHHSSTRRAGGGRVRGRLHTREPSLARVHVHACTRAQPEDLCCLSSRTKGADVYGRTRNHLLWHRFPRVWRAFLPFGFNDSFATPDAARSTRSVALISRNEKNDERGSQMRSRRMNGETAPRFFAPVKIRLHGIIRRKPDGFISFSLIRSASTSVTRYAEHNRARWFTSVSKDKLRRLFF